MTGILAIGLFISTLTTLPIGAMVATVVLTGVSQILDYLPQVS
jgi:ABC-2 type transport system permease protein